MSDPSVPVVVSFTLTRAEFVALLGVADSIAVMIGAGAFIAIFCPLSSFVLNPRTIWERADHGTQTHTFAEDAVTEVLSDSETRYAWRYWRDISLVGDTYVLRSDHGYNFSPRRAFSGPEDEQRFRQLSALVGEGP